MLQRLVEHGLIRGDRIGIDGHREMLERLAAESGIATAEDPIRLDRQRQGKRRSNQDWTSPSDPQAKIAKTKDGRTRLADKPEHAVDLDTAVIVAAEIHPANRSDTTTLPQTLEAAPSTLVAVDAGPTAEDPAELIADKGHHARDGLKELEDSAWKSRIAEKPDRREEGAGRPSLAWHDEARRAVHNNRARLRSGVAKETFKRRAEPVERRFALTLMRLMIGAGTPREFSARASAHLILLVIAADTLTITLIVTTGTEAAMLVVSLEPDLHD